MIFLIRVLPPPIAAATGNRLGRYRSSLQQQQRGSGGDAPAALAAPAAACSILSHGHGCRRRPLGLPRASVGQARRWFSVRDLEKACDILGIPKGSTKEEAMRQKRQLNITINNDGSLSAAEKTARRMKVNSEGADVIENAFYEEKSVYDEYISKHTVAPPSAARKSTTAASSATSRTTTPPRPASYRGDLWVNRHQNFTPRQSSEGTAGRSKAQQQSATRSSGAGTKTHTKETAQPSPEALAFRASKLAKSSQPSPSTREPDKTATRPAPAYQPVARPVPASAQQAVKRTAATREPPAGLKHTVVEFEIPPSLDPTELHDCLCSWHVGPVYKMVIGPTTSIDFVSPDSASLLLLIIQTSGLNMKTGSTISSARLKSSSAKRTSQFNCRHLALTSTDPKMKDFLQNEEKIRRLLRIHGVFDRHGAAGACWIVSPTFDALGNVVSVMRIFFHSIESAEKGYHVLTKSLPRMTVFQLPDPMGDLPLWSQAPLGSSGGTGRNIFKRTAQLLLFVAGGFAVNWAYGFFVSTGSQ